VGPVDSDEWWRRKELRIGFAVYRVRWGGKSLNTNFRHRNTLIQPFPHRSPQGIISYPHRTEGWYWAPEVQTAMVHARRQKQHVTCEILDGWEWIPNEPISWPWEDLMEELYSARLKLKRERNPVQMGYKLSMNSLYGKMAQRAGGKDKPPSSHTLPIAGYVTSWCRAQTMRLMLCAVPGSVISVETDGVFTTTPPEELAGNFPISDKLGEWGVKVWDEMIIIQNGVYLLRKGDTWEPPKSRGIPASAVNVDTIIGHLAQCTGDRWPKLEFQNKEAFVGLGAAISRSTKKNKWGRWSTNPFRARALHCTWKVDPREVDLEGYNSKRAHYAKTCPLCMKGISPLDKAHDMVIHSVADKMGSSPTDIISSSYKLPWEKDYEVEQWRIELGKEGMYDDGDGTIR
jgi:hypothetical protein